PCGHYRARPYHDSRSHTGHSHRVRCGDRARVPRLAGGHMKAGLILPQGWFGEFENWDPIRAYDRIIELAKLAERLGIESLWTGEHVLTKWGGEQVLLECLTLTAALAVEVPRVELGFTVLN